MTDFSELLKKLDFAIQRPVGNKRWKTPPFKYYPKEFYYFEPEQTFEYPNPVLHWYEPDPELVQVMSGKVPTIIHNHPQTRGCSNASYCFRLGFDPDRVAEKGFKEKFVAVNAKYLKGF